MSTSKQDLKNLLRLTKQLQQIQRIYPAPMPQPANHNLIDQKQKAESDFVMIDMNGHEVGEAQEGLGRAVPVAANNATPVNTPTDSTVTYLWKMASSAACVGAGYVYNTVSNLKSSL